MAERPILFSSAMVRAILAGTKTQTRRVLKEQPDSVWGRGVALPGNMLGVRSDAYHVHARVAGEDRYLYCPYGVPGDRLWVRETWGYYPGSLPGEEPLLFRADCPEFPSGWAAHRGPIADFVVWRPSIHMKRADSRITLEVTEVRVQRLQEISEEDAKAEGVEPRHDAKWPDGDPGYMHDVGARTFSGLWDSINGRKAPWDSNPWVWAITFKAGSRG